MGVGPGHPPLRRPGSHPRCRHPRGRGRTLRPSRPAAPSRKAVDRRLAAPVCLYPFDSQYALRADGERQPVEGAPLADRRRIVSLGEKCRLENPLVGAVGVQMVDVVVFGAAIRRVLQLDRNVMDTEIMGCRRPPLLYARRGTYRRAVLTRETGGGEGRGRLAWEEGVRVSGRARSS